MSLREYEYSQKELPGLQHVISGMPTETFATCDPGVVGAAATISLAGRSPRVSSIWPLNIGVHSVAGHLAARDVRVLFQELPYVGRDPTAALRLQRRAGYLPAYLAGLVDPEPVVVVWMRPTSWHQFLRAWCGQNLEKRTDKSEYDAKSVALRYAGEVLRGDGRFEGASEKLKSGIADAVSMAAWASITVFGVGGLHGDG